ncbi:MAG TPA: zf-HC2 domain-containing protein [Vicinamibacterales bacterium]|nr:zf-HC2 domain-containing protein [Vicinamibacterales bacterium]
MKQLTCAQVLRRLSAFHDRELSIEEQIAVEGHLHDCRACAAEASGLEWLGDVLRARAAGLAQVSFDDVDGLEAGVLSRMKAEREESLPSRFGRLFEDLHFVYAGLGAAGATLACLLIMFGMMRFGAHARPDSLAALVEVLAAPASDGATALSGDDGMMLLNGQPGTVDDGRRSDAVFALSAVVTHEGRIRSLDVPHQGGASPNGQAREEILNLMDTIMEAQLQPGLAADGQPVYAATSWRMHVTVRGRAPHLPPDQDPRSATSRGKTTAERGPVTAKATTVVAIA